MEHFKWTPEEISRLTDFQIMKLAFHRRDKQGQIEEEPSTFRSKTMQDDLAALDKIAGLCKIPEDKIGKLKEQVREKWAGKEE